MSSVNSQPLLDLIFDNLRGVHLARDCIRYMAELESISVWPLLEASLLLEWPIFQGHREWRLPPSWQN